MNTSDSRLALSLYLLNATLLLCHEIDSAYWREWNLFRLPGSPEGFVALHIVVVGVVPWGLIAVDRRSPTSGS